MTNAWCHDIPRDEAVRAAEDNRQGPLPTLEEAIAAITNHDAPPGARVSDRQCASPADTGANTELSRAGQSTPFEPSCGPKCTERDRVTERRPVQPGGGGNVTGSRTERVTLEVTHDLDAPLGEWIVQVIDESLGFDESVRVVDNTAERITQALTADRFAAAVAEADRLKARVAELEAAAKLAPPANAAAVSNPRPISGDGKSAGEETQAASGAAGTEAMAWGVRRKGGVDAVVHRLFRSSAEASAEQYGGTVVPLYAAPQAAPGWLTAEERGSIQHAANLAKASWSYSVAQELENILARSSPPEVVLPGRWKAVEQGHPERSWQPFIDQVTANRDADWLAALAAAGVTVKEVRRE